MSQAGMNLTVVDQEGYPAYPISANDRLDSHYFLQWNLKRWRGSEFRKKAYSDPEVGWYGFELFCMSQDETPIGTLPCDDRQLAFGLHLPLEKWLDLRKRDLSPLHGWNEVMCDNGEVRYAHSVVTEIAVEALGSKRRNASKNADSHYVQGATVPIDGVGSEGAPGSIDSALQGMIDAALQSALDKIEQGGQQGA